jgi:WD40 repeat protein
MKKKIKIWDLTIGKEINNIKNAHNGFINSLIIDQTSKEEKESRYFSCSTDKYLKLWKLKPNKMKEEEDDKPIQTYLSESPLLCMGK